MVLGGNNSATDYLSALTLEDDSMKTQMSLEYSRILTQKVNPEVVPLLAEPLNPYLEQQEDEPEEKEKPK